MSGRFLREPFLTSDELVRDPILRGAFSGELLGAPACLSAGELKVAARDIRTYYDVACSLPQRLYDGDVAAMARAVGFGHARAELISASAAAGRRRPLGRADLYHDGQAFRLLEMNVTSALGGFEIGRLNEAVLRADSVQKRVEARDLRFADPMRAVARTLLAEHLETGTTPYVVALDIAQNIPPAGGALRGLAALLEEHGIEARACHPAELSLRDGAPMVDGRRIDMFFRHFMLEDFSHPELAAELGPVVSAVLAGKVPMCSGLDAELYGSKGVLATLSDEVNRPLLSTAERDCVDRLIPWTRYVRARSTEPGGSRIELLPYALAHQDDLVLKPTHMHGGIGVIPGWRVDAAEWSSRLREAMDGPFILQRRVEPETESYPAGGTDPARELAVNWGIFFADEEIVGNCGYAGCVVRAMDSQDVGVVSAANGALVGCAFHEELT
ncbi:MAG: hypothetical protein V7643_3212 [Mycobacterium sp.]